MNEDKESGRVPLTIDSNGNVVPRRYGVSRWSSPKVYDCEHDECFSPAVVLSAVNTAHNCCKGHDEEDSNG